MPVSIAIDFPSPTLGEIHRIRNFGEDLYRAFKENDWAEISLDAVDAATDRLLVMVPHRKQVRRVEALIEHLDRVGTVSRLEL